MRCVYAISVQKHCKFVNMSTLGNFGQKKKKLPLRLLIYYMPICIRITNYLLYMPYYTMYGVNHTHKNNQ